MANPKQVYSFRLTPGDVKRLNYIAGKLGGKGKPSTTRSNAVVHCLKLVDGWYKDGQQLSL